MKILYLCADRGIPVRGHKGASVHVRAMANAFTRSGHIVTILTPRPGPGDGSRVAAAIVEAPLPKLAGDDDDPRAAGELQAVRYSQELLRTARDLHAARGFDLIYERYSLWSDTGAWLAQATGLPFVLEVNAPLIEEAQRYRSLLDVETAAAIERIQFGTATAISVVSETLRRYVIERGASRDRVFVVPNGVDPQHFHPAVRGGSVRHAYGLHDRIVVGFVGRPRPWHDLETLLAAVARLRAGDPAYHLLLVGEMPDDLAAQLDRYGLRAAATVTGGVAHEDVPRHIAAMDVAVSTHLAAHAADFYFSPLKLFEYLACGVPVVAADIGQPSQIVRDGLTGYRYPPGDAAALAAVIEALVRNPAHAREVAWQGAAAVLQGYTWDGNARQVLDWIRQGGRGEGEEAAVAGPETVQPPDRVPGHALPLVDPKLRQRLYRATRPDLAAPYLGEVLVAAGIGARHAMAQVDTIAVLKYKPGRRCVLAYDVALAHPRTGARSTHRIVGKVFRDDRGQRLHNLQEALWQDGFGPHAGDQVVVPRSLGYVPEMRMQVQECAPGTTLNELAAHGPVTEPAARCGQALAKLHQARSLAADGHDAALQPYRLGDEIGRLDAYTSTILAWRSDEAARVLALRAVLERWGRELPEPEALATVHRDFYYSQVLFDRSRLTLIDFDLVSLGDPAIDVANFTAHLAFLGLDKRADLDALAVESEQFLAAYARHAAVDGAFLRRWAWYQAATFFRLLNVVAPRPGLAHTFDPLLAQTERCLERSQ
jgi:glycosyltransferase involved in cell wall biosynthesis